MLKTDTQKGVVTISEDAIYIVLDDSEDPISMPKSRYPDLEDGVRVEVWHNEVGILHLKKLN